MTQATQLAAAQERAYLDHSVSAFDQSTAKRNGSTAAAEPGTVYEEVMGAVQRNPVLAIATVATVSALVVMALKPSRTPQSKLRTLERRAVRQLADAEKQLRSAMHRSGVSSSLENIAGSLTARLATLDASQLEPLKQRASSMLNHTLDRLGTMMK